MNTDQWPVDTSDPAWLSYFSPHICVVNHPMMQSENLLNMFTTPLSFLQCQISSRFIASFFFASKFIASLLHADWEL
ncbi:hypothetical protein PAHAL_1G269200 [Panicum hallii]|uniref:Uncharacterized protein n=1 Tax=Panicum hallii TaxID=206008 RepID=A0A2T8KWF4_9POAL|nr:hypothetical protein PAHAL_1G269200 [Panicum hallii]